MKVGDEVRYAGWGVSAYRHLKRAESMTVTEVGAGEHGKRLKVRVVYDTWLYPDELRALRVASPACRTTTVPCGFESCEVHYEKGD